MQENEQNNDKKEQEEVVVKDPFSPVNTGIPVVVKDSSGKRIGNTWSLEKSPDLMNAYKNTSAGKASKIYYDSKNKTFANYPMSSMSYSNGKITLNVAKVVADSDWYKNIFNSDEFNSLAKLYKDDPTGETIISSYKYEEDGEKKEVKKSINEYLAEYAELLEKNSKSYQTNIDIRNRAKEFSDGALLLTDDDIAIMQAYQDIRKNSSNFYKSALLLPDSVKDYFRNYESYDETTGSISGEDFQKKFYHLDDPMNEGLKEAIDILGGGTLGDDAEALQNVGESDKDYAIDLIRLRTSQEMSDIVERLAFYKNDMSATEKAKLATEYAKCYALQQAMNEASPDANMWTGFNLGLQNIAHGFLDYSDKMITDFVEFASNVWSGVTYVSNSTLSDMVSLIDFSDSVLEDLFTGGIDKVENNLSENLRIFDKNREKFTGDNSMVGEQRQMVKNQINEFRKEGGVFGTVFGDMVEFGSMRTMSFDELGTSSDIGKAYADSEKMQAVGKFMAFLAQQVLLVNPVGNAVGSWVGAKILASEGLSMEYLTKALGVFSKFAENSNSLSMTLGALEYINGISKFSKIASFVSNVYVQGIVETFLNNPSYTDALIYGEDPSKIAELMEIITSNVVSNAFGETLPFGIHYGAGKLANISKKASQTKAGSVVQAMLRKGVNRITLTGRQMLQKVAKFAKRNKTGFVVEEFVDDNGKIFNTQTIASWKRQQNLRDEIIAIQKKIRDVNIWKGAENVDDILESAKKIDELIDERVNVEVVLGAVKKQALAEKGLAIIKNAGLNIETAALSEDTARLSQICRKMGQTNVGGSFSTETTDYINDLFGIQRLTNKQLWLENHGKALSKNEASALETLTERVAKYEESLPIDAASEYKELVKDYMDHNFRFYYKINNYLASDAAGNILTEEELAAMRISQYGPNGEQWMRQIALNPKRQGNLQQIIQDPTKIIKQGMTKNALETQQRFELSPDTVYLDPNYTRKIYLNGAAQLMQAADMGDAVVRSGRGLAIQVDSSGKIFKSKAEISEAKHTLSEKIKENFRKAIGQNRKELGVQTLKNTHKEAKKFFQIQAGSAKSKINRILGLNMNGLKGYAEDLSSAEAFQLSTVFTMPAYSTKVRTRAQLDTLYNSLSKAQKETVKATLNGRPLNVRTWNEAVLNDNLDVKLIRNYVKENKGILKSDYYLQMVRRAREADLAEDELMSLREADIQLAEAEEALASGGKKSSKIVESANKQKDIQFGKIARGSITEAVNAVIEWLENASDPYLEALIKEYEKNGISSDLARRYLVLEWLQKNAKNGGLKEVMADFYKTEKESGINLNSKEAAEHLAEKFIKATESNIESRFNKISQRIIDSGVDGLVDNSMIVENVNKYLMDIVDKWDNRQIVEVFDRASGSLKYYEVDSNTYNLVMYYPTFQKNNWFVRLLARLNSIARAGIITFRAASLVTQGFKDSINAIVGGGWEQLLLNDPTTWKKVAEYIGPDVVEAFKKEMTPSAWKDFLAQAEWDGLTVQEAIAKYELSDEMLSVRLPGGGTSSSYYSTNKFRSDTADMEKGVAQQTKDTWTTEMKNKWNAAYDEAKASLAVARGWVNTGISFPKKLMDGLHDARENFLRTQVYRQNFLDALDNGKSLNQARNYAQFVMENATTKFTRGFTWGEAFIKSIPFFGAAINGASSFIRLLEIDPVGVMMRFTTDILVPTIGLTTLSLSDPTDAEIYKNIPEYRKRESLIWVVGGQTMTIPLPEEMAKFVLPFRHLVEKAEGANDNAWYELLINDILNIPVVPLNGIMALDVKRIKSDPTIFDRISETAMDLFNVLSPTAARTAYIAVTGRDPYTGKNYGKERYFLNAETGEYELMVESEYDFCNDLAELFKGWGWEVSPLMAEGLLSGSFGTGSLDILEGIRDFAATAQAGELNMGKLLEPSLERAADVLYDKPITDADKARSAWYSVYYKIKEEREALLRPNGKLYTASTNIKTAKTAEALEKAQDAYNNQAHDWHMKVIDEIRQYNELYGDYYDSSKLASTLTMMTLESTISRSTDNSNYYNERALAIQTLYDAGFTSTSDTSIFGRVYRNSETGEVTIKYNDPLLISMTSNALWYQSDEYAEAITNTIKFSGLKEKYSSDIYQRYKKYMDEKNYNEANKLAATWDLEVIKTIKPILDSYGVDDPFAERDIVNAIYPYFLIPNTKEYLGKGQYYSSKTGLVKKSGFIQSVARQIYKSLKEAK